LDQPQCVVVNGQHSPTPVLLILFTQMADEPNGQPLTPGWLLRIMHTEDAESAGSLPSGVAGLAGGHPMSYDLYSGGGRAPRADRLPSFRFWGPSTMLRRSGRRGRPPRRPHSLSMSR